MFEQILSISKIRNIWRTVSRIYMLISGLKGLSETLNSSVPLHLGIGTNEQSG